MVVEWVGFNGNGCGCSAWTLPSHPGNKAVCGCVERTFQEDEP